jgi:hypothetical protein
MFMGWLTKNSHYGTILGGPGDKRKTVCRDLSPLLLLFTEKV